MRPLAKQAAVLSIAMILRYARLAPEHKAAAVETLVAKEHDEAA